MASGVGTTTVVDTSHAMAECGIASRTPVVGAVPGGRTLGAGSPRGVASLVFRTVRHRQADLETTTGGRFTDVSGTAILGDAALDAAMKGKITARATRARALIVENAGYTLSRRLVAVQGGQVTVGVGDTSGGPGLRVLVIEAKRDATTEGWQEGRTENRQREDRSERSRRSSSTSAVHGGEGVEPISRARSTVAVSRSGLAGNLASSRSRSCTAARRSPAPSALRAPPKRSFSVASVETETPSGAELRRAAGRGDACRRGSPRAGGVGDSVGAAE